MNKQEETEYKATANAEEPKNIVEEPKATGQAPKPAAEEPKGNRPAQGRVPWKMVTIGGVTGILMGAGSAYALNARATAETDEPQAEPGTVTTNEETGMKVAQVTDDMSFGEAFATAREAAGGGGVFHWRGNVYNTFTREEWEAMTPAERNEFARAAQPEIADEAAQHPHNDYAQAQHHEPRHDDHQPSQAKKAPAAEDADHRADAHRAAERDLAKDDHRADDADIRMVKRGDDAASETTDSDDADIRVVGTDKVDDHDVVMLDTSGDGKADVAVIDMDNNQRLSDPDIIIDKYGNAITVGGDDPLAPGYTQHDDPAADIDAGMDDVGLGTQM